MTGIRLRLVTILCVCTMMFGCAVHYKNVPNDIPSSPSYAAPQNVYFKVFDRPVVSTDGPELIKKTLLAHDYFVDAVQVYDNEIPTSGVFVEVNPKYQAPSFPALVFGYLSLSTLTLLPAWSNDDGFDVVFTVYNNGDLVKTYSYETRRFLATWAGLLPFIWVNLLTEDESAAFEAITQQFLEDAQLSLQSDI